MLRQLAAAPLELLGAAGIIYFALPDAVNPGFIPVLAIFLASFSVALASHAPGGLGVFEIVFLTAMNIAETDERVRTPSSPRCWCSASSISGFRR